MNQTSKTITEVVLAIGISLVIFISYVEEGAFLNFVGNFNIGPVIYLVISGIVAVFAYKINVKKFAITYGIINTLLFFVLNLFYEMSMGI